VELRDVTCDSATCNYKKLDGLIFFIIIIILLPLCLEHCFANHQTDRFLVKSFGDFNVENTLKIKEKGHFHSHHPTRFHVTSS
jgi:hypothetical protein